MIGTPGESDIQSTVWIQQNGRNNSVAMHWLQILSFSLEIIENSLGQESDMKTLGQTSNDLPKLND